MKRSIINNYIYFKIRVWTPHPVDHLHQVIINMSFPMILESQWDINLSLCIRGLVLTSQGSSVKLLNMPLVHEDLFRELKKKKLPSQKKLIEPCNWIAWKVYRQFSALFLSYVSHTLSLSFHYHTLFSFLCTFYVD